MNMAKYPNHGEEGWPSHSCDEWSPRVWRYRTGLGYLLDRQDNRISLPSKLQADDDGHAVGPPAAGLTLASVSAERCPPAAPLAAAGGIRLDESRAGVLSKSIVCRPACRAPQRPRRKVVFRFAVAKAPRAR